MSTSNGKSNHQSNNGNFYENGSSNQYSYEDIEAIAKYLLERITIKPKIGIICGSGLGSMATSVKNATTFDYKDIPNFPISTIIGHAGKLLFGLVEGVPVVCMQGRFHFYEGYPLWKCVMPVRLMKILGVTHLIASNAAGGLNPKYKVGDIMLIKDHVNVMGFAGNNPLQGLNDTRFGPRFVALNNAYDLDILKNVRRLASELGMDNVVQEGVYTCLGGPNFETIAELKALSKMGVDAVGMSTVHEVIAARHCDMKCFAFSLITNKCVMEYESKDEPNSEEVIAVAKEREGDLKILIENVVKYLGSKLQK